MFAKKAAQQFIVSVGVRLRKVMPALRQDEQARTCDVMVVAGRDVMALPLDVRREMLRSRVLSKLADPIRESPEVAASLPEG